MKSRLVTVPELGLIAGTRAMLGMGASLVLANRLSSEQRRAIGWTLLVVGALTTIPLAAEVLFRDESPDRMHPSQENDALSGASSRMGVEQS